MRAVPVARSVRNGVEKVIETVIAHEGPHWLRYAQWVFWIRDE